MGKQDVVAVQKAAILQGQDAALESGLEACFDAGLASAPPSGGFQQSDIDAAVAAAVAPLNDQIAAAAQQFADEVSKEQSEASQLSDAQAKLTAVKAALGL